MLCAWGLSPCAFTGRSAPRWSKHRTQPATNGCKLATRPSGRFNPNLKGLRILNNTDTTTEHFAAEKAAFAQGKMIQFEANPDEWIDCEDDGIQREPLWFPGVVYLIKPDSLVTDEIVDEAVKAYFTNRNDPLAPAVRRAITRAFEMAGVADLTRRLEEVREDAQEAWKQRDAHKARADELEKALHDAYVAVNIQDGQDGETLAQMINRKIMQRDAWHTQRIEQYHAEKARADKAEGELAKLEKTACLCHRSTGTGHSQDSPMCQRCHEQMNAEYNTNAELQSLRQQLAEKEKEAQQVKDRLEHWHRINEAVSHVQSDETLVDAAVRELREAKQLRAELASLRDRLAPITTGQGDIRAQGPTCQTCQWTNVDCLNISGAFICHGCIQKELISLREQTQRNRGLRGNIDRLLEEAGFRVDCSLRNQLSCMNFDASVNLPSIEKSDEFQEWFVKMYGHPIDVDLFQAMRAAWNKAREGKV